MITIPRWVDRDLTPPPAWLEGLPDESHLERLGTDRQRELDEWIDDVAISRHVIDRETMRRNSPTGEVRCRYPSWAPEALRGGYSLLRDRDLPRSVARSAAGRASAVLSARAEGRDVVGEDEFEELTCWALDEVAAHFMPMIRDLATCLPPGPRGLEVLEQIRRSHEEFYRDLEDGFRRTAERHGLR